MNNPANSPNRGVAHAPKLLPVQYSRKLKRGSLALGLALTLLVGGCSSLPDYANPGTWYEEASGTVGGWMDTVKGDWFENLNADWSPDLTPTWLPRWLGGGDSAVAKAKSDTLVGDSANARHRKPATDAQNPSAALVVKSSETSTLWPRKPAPGTAALLTKSASQTGTSVAKANDRKVLIKPMPAKKVAKAAVKPAQKQAAAAAPQARTAVVTNAPAAINAAKKPAPAPTAAATAAAAPVAQQAAQNTAPVPAQKFSLKKFFTTPAANSDSRETTMSFHNLLGTNPLPSASDQGAEPMSAVIYFANGSAQISAKGRAIVAKLVAMAGDENTIIRVVGHASRRTRDMDPVKHKLVNLNVSVQRANAVVAEILRRGVPRSKIEAVARGASMPMYLEIMPAGEAGNRRVEIFVERLS